MAAAEYENVPEVEVYQTLVQYRAKECQGGYKEQHFSYYFV